MGVLDELLSRIFLSLENFFQKASELDVFEDFVFSYKIKLVSVEKCSSEFLTTFAELENELHLAIKECMYLSNGHWELFTDSLLQQDVVGDHLIDTEDDNLFAKTQPSPDDSHQKAVVVIPVEPPDKACTDISIKNNAEQLLPNHQLQPVKCASNNIINGDEAKQYANDTALINPIRIISSVSSNASNQSIVSNIFKCDFCFRKFGTFLKLTKHSCKKRSVDNKAVQQVTINIETNNSVNTDDSTTIYADDDKLPTNDEEQALPLEQPTALSSQPSVQVTQFHEQSNQNHRNSHSLHEEPDLPVYSCTLCCISFLEKSQWDEHVCKEKEGSVNCKRGVIATRSLLEKHNRFICGFCLETYRSLSRIMYHLVRCFTGPYNCEVCSNPFTTRRELNYHKNKQHKGIESFFCDECGLGFKLRTSLQKHLINRHENLQGEYHCDIAGCQLVFPKKIFLTRHKINKHRLERKYLCQVCGNKFYNSCSLSSHLETHSDKNQFSCPICSRLLKTKEKLILHIRTHTGEKPYPCTICGKSFVAKSKLEEHSRRHRGEKRYKCINCGKLYANSFDLRQHIKRKCSHNNGDVKDLMEIADKSTVNQLQTKSTNKINLIRRSKPLQSQVPDHQITSILKQTSQQSIEGKGNNNAILQETLPNNSNSDNVTDTTSSNSSTSNGSGMIIQLDSNNRVIPLQTTAVHVVDYVPYYQSSDPIHIVMPPQTLVLSGYDNINY